MKPHLYPMALAGIVAGLLVNWATPETTISGQKKPKINFFGILETDEGNRYNVENISIGMIYKQIPLFEMPKRTTEGNYQLTKDPRKGIISRISLSEIAAISVPHPDIQWIYKKKGFAKNEYVELIVTSNDQQQTRCNYLIDLRRKLYCDKINEAGPIELEVPFTSLKRITIQGSRERESECSKEKAPQA